MLWLEANQIEKYYGDRLIIKADQLQVYEGERIGIVGKNGKGKSTLLKILAQKIEPDRGAVSLHVPIALVPQLDSFESSDITTKYSKQWGIPQGDRLSLSGGEITRKKIAAALSSDAKLILADEPTSHLDMEGIEKFEKELKEFAGSVILISHDQELLNQVCTTIWEVEDGRVHCYEGNYDDYLAQKQHKFERQWFEYDQYTKEKQRLEQAAIEKSQKSKSLKKAPSRMGNSEARLHKRSVGQKKAKLDRGVKAIRSRIEQLEKKEKPKVEEDITFDLTHFQPIHSKTVISFQQVKAKIGDRQLFDKLNGSIQPGSKVAIVGKNGVGKSTLLHMIASGAEGISVAKPATIGFFHQQLENLHEKKTILDNIMETSPYTELFIRTVLSRLHFKREDVHKKVELLSGGERVKTALAKVFLGSYNVLLLDEPSNYLDLQTRAALQKVLQAYPGTIIFVTHDRYFVQELATHILQIENNKGILREKDQFNVTRDSSSGHDQETTLLAIDLELTEVINKLSLARSEEEKQLLEDKYSELLRRKKQLLI